jgi:hypothetical protein
MKLRLGFVSNSSSSSFVAAIKTKDYNKIVEELIEKEIDDELIADFIGGKPVATDGDMSLVHIGYNEDSEYINKNSSYNFPLDDHIEEMHSLLGTLCDRIKKKTKLYHEDQ